VQKAGQVANSGSRLLDNELVRIHYRVMKNNFVTLGSVTVNAAQIAYIKYSHDRGSGEIVFAALSGDGRPLLIQTTADEAISLVATLKMQ
jgi:hypothetical protein